MRAQNILGQLRWLDFAARDLQAVPTELEQERKQLERQFIEQQKNLRACQRCGIPYSPTHPICRVCSQRPK